MHRRDFLKGALGAWVVAGADFLDASPQSHRSYRVRFDYHFGPQGADEEMIPLPSITPFQKPANLRIEGSYHTIHFWDFYAYDRSISYIPLIGAHDEPSEYPDPYLHPVALVHFDPRDPIKAIQIVLEVRQQRPLQESDADLEPFLSFGSMPEYDPCCFFWTRVGGVCPVGFSMFKQARKLAGSSIEASVHNYFSIASTTDFGPMPYGNPQAWASEYFAILCRCAKIPSRIVRGINLETRKTAMLTEVFLPHRGWMRFDLGGKTAFLDPWDMHFITIASFRDEGRTLSYQILGA
ncbi:transglutaminase domain-containing protein [Helicobacter vulpis]|uniref:transglutaminase domain-containing protein n=1 Tax=Helicobacter vulpis TaxID=2316076 RepID=UPI000EAD2D10|nr:transglutaminase domain-containing protein [Helicobacter vulpis]